MRVLVVAGTKDGRDLCRYLQSLGHCVTASVVTLAAAQSLQAAGIDTVTGRRDAASFAVFLRVMRADALVDAAHPFADRLRQNLYAAASCAGVLYVRYERPAAPLPHHPGLVWASDTPAAASLAAASGDTVFLTTGIKTAGVFLTAARKTGARVVVRVLPKVESVMSALDLGFPETDIVAMRGPFTEDLHTALFRHYHARVLVTKETGNEGFVLQKVQAALMADMTVIVISRPEISWPDRTVSTFAAIAARLQDRV